MKTEEFENRLKSKGLKWVHPFNEEDMVNVIPNFLKKEIKKTDHFSDEGRFALAVKLYYQIFSNDSYLRVVDMKKLINQFDEKEGFYRTPSYWYNELVDEMNEKDGGKMKEEIIFSDEIVSEIAHKMKRNLNFSSVEKREFENWMPGYLLKATFNPVAFEEKIKEDVIGIENLFFLKTSAYAVIEYTLSEELGILIDAIVNENKILPKIKKIFAY